MTLRLSASVLVVAVVLGHAQPTANINRSEDISPARMLSLLQGMGFEVTEKPSDDATAFAFGLNGRIVTLITQAKSMQLSACFEDPVPLLRINQWNREHFSTGVRLEQGCPVLRADVKFGGSYTDQMLEEFIAGFLTDVTIYARFVKESPPAPGTPYFPPGAAPPVADPPATAPADRPKSPIGPMEWSQLGQNPKSVPPGPDAATSAPGLLQINRNISLKYEPDRWKETGPGNNGQWVLEHASGNLHAAVIAERIAVPRVSVEDIALANAQSADPKAQIAFRQQRRSMVLLSGA